jgi:hypothetical protein
LPAREGIVDLQPLFFGLTLDTTTALLLGQSVYSLKAHTTNDVDNREFAENFTLRKQAMWIPTCARSAKGCLCWKVGFVDACPALENFKLFNSHSSSQQSVGISATVDHLFHVQLHGVASCATIQWIFSCCVYGDKLGGN